MVPRRPACHPSITKERSRGERGFGQLFRTSAQCRLPSIELFPAVALVMAGYDLGCVPGSRQRVGRIRSRRSLPNIRDGIAVGHCPERVRTAGKAAGFYAV